MLKKNREAITPIVDTVKLWVSKYSTERSQGQYYPEVGKSDLVNFGNLEYSSYHKPFYGYY